MVVITSGETLAKHKDLVWKALDAQRQAIALLQQKPNEAAKLIAPYFIAEPTLKTLSRGELPRETVISEAISTQVFMSKLTSKDTVRMQEIADIMQAQGSLKTRDGKPYKVDGILDLSWQEARKL
jgi:NitT/TauT family transport system substrate-binding protein